MARWGVAAGLGVGLALYTAGQQRQQAQAAPKARSQVRCLAAEAGTSSLVSRLLSVIRDRKSDQNEFVFNTDRLLKILVEVALADLDATPSEVLTPTGHTVPGFELTRPVAAVSILRSGDALMKAFIEAKPNAPTGKLLLVKHEPGDPGDSDINVLYSKVPKNLGDCQVLLLDPMLASGSTMILALRVLADEYKVDARNVTVVSMLSCPEGVRKVQEAFPQVRIVTAAMDRGQDEHQYMVPGLGSFGDRYFGTH